MIFLGGMGRLKQKKFYVECGAKLDGKYPGDSIWREFCNRIGWHNGDSYLYYKDLKAHPHFSTAGEFPACGMFGGLFLVGGGWLVARVQRLVNCSR